MSHDVSVFEGCLVQFLKACIGVSDVDCVFPVGLLKSMPPTLKDVTTMIKAVTVNRVKGG